MKNITKYRIQNGIELVVKIGLIFGLVILAGQLGWWK